MTEADNTFHEFINNSTPANRYIIEALGLIRGIVACKVIYSCNLKDKVCRFGISRMALELGIDKSTVSRTLEWLTANGYIIQVQKPTNTEPGHYTPSEKLINLLSPVALCNTPVAVRNTPVAQCNQDKNQIRVNKDTTTTRADFLRSVLDSMADTLAGGDKAGLLTALSPIDPADKLDAVGQAFIDFWHIDLAAARYKRLARDVALTCQKFGLDSVLWAMLVAQSPDRQDGKNKTWGYVKGILKNDTANANNPRNQRSAGVTPPAAGRAKYHPKSPGGGQPAGPKRRPGVLSGAMGG